MFFLKKSNVMFRDYVSFGYVTDNRNFGYKKAIDDITYIGDKILSDSGSVFFSVLDVRPKSIEVLAGEIIKKFDDVDMDIIINDAKEFYSRLEKDGFVVSGETPEECEKKDFLFSYKENSANIVKKELLQSLKEDKTTQDFLEEYFNGKPLLTNLHVEITSRCNERCIHCYIPHEDKTKDMPPEMLYCILDQCRDMNVLHLTVTGGEPMLHEKFYDLLKKCREYNFSVNILSNLTFLNDKIVREMKRNPLLGVQTSLYSMRPSVHDEITQTKGSFEKTKNAILKLVENNIPLQISCPVMKQNKRCYADVIDWAKSYNVHAGDDYVIIARYDHATQNLKCRLSLNEVKELIDKKIAADARYLEKIEKEAENKKEVKPDDYVCSVCNSSICIAENGNVYPCAGWQDYVVGNIKGSSGFSVGS